MLTNTKIKLLKNNRVFRLRTCRAVCNSSIFKYEKMFENTTSGKIGILIL